MRATMGIENLSSSLLRPPCTPGINECPSTPSNPNDPAAATVFLKQLAEQIADLKDSESTQAIVDTLNPELIAAASGLPDGKILPLPATANPQLPDDRNRFVSIDLKGPGPASPIPPSQWPITAQAGTETIPRAMPGSLLQDHATPLTDAIASGDSPEIAPSNALAGEFEKPGQNGAEKILTDTALGVKGEWLNPRSSVRNPSESEKAPVLTLERAVTEPEWKDDLGNRIFWMARNSMAAAELKVNPPQMGPVEVRINLQQDQMNVVFASQNAAVRDAIEAAIPRLREMLGGHQVNLMHVEVSNSFADQHRQQPNGEGGGRSRGEPFTDSLFASEQSGLDELETSILLKNQGLLNYYV
ncbi:MAG: flagellar hook-length control protein FliK [Methylococcaceae bacterium]|nr:flagellar hook-length control protein FliK [Methylococcaceae bacterium]